MAFPLEPVRSHPLLKPWYDSLDDPSEAQDRTLEGLVEKYAKTLYGSEHHAQDVEGIDDYRESFPKLDYQSLRRHLEPVKRGNYASFLWEPPEVWVMTRGSTGMSKTLPATRTHLQQIFSCGYDLLGYFTLHEDTWWVGYYAPLEKRINEIRTKHADDPKVLAALDKEQQFIDMFKKNPERYGSVFFVMKKK